MAEPAIGAAYTRTELLAASSGDTSLLNAMRKAWHADVSGDVQLVLKPNWLLTSFATGSRHGSSYSYDTHVPLLVYAPGWYKPGRVDAPDGITSITPTPAQLLDLALPLAAAAKALPISAL